MTNAPIAQGIIEFGGDASGVTAAAAEVGKSLDSIGSKVKQLGNESGDGFKKVEDGAKGATKATQTWNEYLKENIAEARKQFASQDLSKIEAYNAAVKKVADQWRDLNRAKQTVSAPASLGVGEVDALTKAQDRLLNSIIRQSTVVTEGKARWLELKAAQAGLSEQAAPYIAKLKAIEKTTNDVGASQKQLTAAMRGVPAQFTDIITSLQGGQQPLTVFLQQGGQLKDMFGGAGNAARALGSYILGLVNPFTVTAAAIGAIGYAYSQANETAKEFQKTLIITGNAAGTTSDQMIQLTKDISAVGAGSVKSANEAVNALVATGKVSFSVLEQATLATVRAQSLLGKSVQDTSKEFADLAKSPTKAIIDLNDKYNFLTLDIYKQIKALEDQGRATDAAKLAQTTYAEALLGNSNKVNETLTDWERGWNRIKKATSDAADAALRVFDEDTNAEKLKKLFKIRDDLEKSQSKLSGDNSFLNIGQAARIQAQLDANKAEINAIREKEKATKDAAKAQDEANKANAAGIEFAKQGAEFLSKSEKMQKELTAATQLYLAGRTEANKRTEQDAELQDRLSKIRDKYKETISKEENAYKSLSRSISEKLALSQIELSNEKPLTEAQKLRVKLMEMIESGHGKITSAQIKEESKKIDLIRSNELARQSYENLRKEIEKFKPTLTADDVVAGLVKQDKAYFDLVGTQQQYRQSLQDNAALMELESSLAGQSAIDRNTAIEQYKIEIALQKELLKIKQDVNLSKAQKDELSDTARENANIAKSQAALKVQQGEWSKFYQDIYNGLTDSLYRGFEAGKGFFQSFWDGIKNLFKTTVLKLAVQGVMGGIVGSIPNIAQAFSGAESASNAGSLIGIGKTIYDGFAGGFAGFGDTVSKSVQAALDKAGLSMSGGTPGTFAQGAGTVASYGAGIAAGIYGGRAISGGYSVTGGNALVNVGTAAGAFFGGPIGAAIGGAIAGGVNRLFGMKAAELQYSEFSGSVGASGFMATTRDVFKAEGGLFRSDKWSETKTPLADTTGLTAQYEAIAATAKSYADLLGLSTASLASFSKSFTFNLSKTGDAAKDAEANQKLINDLFVGITNDITNLLAPSISAFGKEGETASQTLQRLATSLTGVNAVMKSVGFAEFSKSLEGANAAQRLAELTGGIEKLASGAQYFFDNFLTDAEKLKPSADLVTATMARLGQSAVDTVPEFKQLVQGLDLTNEAQAKMYAELIAIAPQFKAIADSKAAEELKKLSEATKELEIAAQKAKEIADERKALQDEYNSLTMTSSQLFEIYKNSLDVSNQSLAESIQAIKDKTAAEEAAAAKAASIAAERKTLQDEYNSLTMTAVELMAQYRNGLDASNQALFDQINVIKAAREKALAEEKAAAEALAAAQKEASDIAAERATLQDEYNRLTMTEIELMSLKRASLKEQNRDLFDLIQTEKARREEAAKAEAALKASESEWAQSMKAAFDSQTGALKNIISEFGSLAKSLQDYSRSLTLGEAAKLSPETRYKLLGEEINALMPQVKAGDKDALAKWAKVSEEYLKASEGYNATSVGYFKDLELIKTYTDEAAKYAQSQVDVAQSQLNAMTNSVDAINGVNKSVQQVLQAITGSAGGGAASASSSMSGITAAGVYGSSIVRDVEQLGGKDALLKGAESGDPYGRRNLQLQLERWSLMDLKAADIDQILGKGWIDKFLKSLGIPVDLFDQRVNFSKYISENMQKIPGFANGGIASGLAVVGERGPELVNFKSPSRVYNANDTQSIIGGSNSKETNDLLREQNRLLRQILTQSNSNDKAAVQTLKSVDNRLSGMQTNANFEKAGT